MSLTAAPSTTTLPDTRQGRELTQQALEQLATPEGWRSWLAVRAAMPQLSLPNQLLVAYQHPQATHLATFRTWLNRGYVVRRHPEHVAEGQYAVRVWEPKPPSCTQLAQWRAGGSDPALYPQTVFRLTNEFAQDQVTPMQDAQQRICIDPLVRDLDGEDLAPLIAPLLALIAEFDVTADTPAGPCNLAVARLCRAAARLIVASDTVAGANQPGADDAVTADAVARVCIRGLGLDPDALTASNGDPTPRPSMPLVPLQTATVVDRLARRLAEVLHPAAAD